MTLMMAMRRPRCRRVEQLQQAYTLRRRHEQRQQQLDGIHDGARRIQKMLLVMLLCISIVAGKADNGSVTIISRVQRQHQQQQQVSASIQIIRQSQQKQIEGGREGQGQQHQQEAIEWKIKQQRQQRHRHRRRLASPSLSSSANSLNTTHSHGLLSSFKSHLSDNPRIADVEEGYFFAFLAFILLGCLYQCCCVVCCGYCCQNHRSSTWSCCWCCGMDRTERQRRRTRIVQDDGRGVFAPVLEDDDDDFAEYGEEEFVTRRSNYNGGHRTLANEYGDPEDWDQDADDILEASAKEYFDHRQQQQQQQPRSIELTTIK